MGPTRAVVLGAVSFSQGRIPNGKERDSIFMGEAAKEFSRIRRTYPTSFAFPQAPKCDGR